MNLWNDDEEELSKDAVWFSILNCLQYILFALKVFQSLEKCVGKWTLKILNPIIPTSLFIFRAEAHPLIFSVLQKPQLVHIYSLPPIDLVEAVLSWPFYCSSLDDHLSLPPTPNAPYGCIQNHLENLLMGRRLHFPWEN